jgi:anti-sigma regulatory factor (Ser/Thr protein kinase)
MTHAAAESRAELDLTLRNSRDELPRLAEQVAALTARAGLSSLVEHRLNLVLEEIIGNTIAYGFPDGGEHTLRVRLAVLADAIELEIRDDARPFDPLAERPAPYLGDDLDRRRPGGLGLHLVRRLVRGGKYVTESGNNRLSLKMDKEVDKAPPFPVPPTPAGGEVADGS